MNRSKMRNNKRSTENNSKVLWVLKSLLIAYIVTALLLFVLAGLLYKMNLGEKTVSAGIIAIYITSTLAGGIALGKMAKTRRFLWGLSIGAGYFVLLLLITFGVYRTIDTAGMNLVTTFVLCAGGGMVGGMIS